MYGKRLLSRISLENGRLTRSRGDVRWVLHGALDAALFQALAAGALPGIRLDPVPLVCSQAREGRFALHLGATRPTGHGRGRGRWPRRRDEPARGAGPPASRSGLPATPMAHVASGEVWRGGRRGAPGVGAGRQRMRQRGRAPLPGLGGGLVAGHGREGRGGAQPARVRLGQHSPDRLPGAARRRQGYRRPLGAVSPVRPLPRRAGWVRASTHHPLGL
jgi:hypothetical protein